MRVLLDTDVVIDFLMAREPFAQRAREIFEQNAQKKIQTDFGGGAVGHRSLPTARRAEKMKMDFGGREVNAEWKRYET